MVYVLWQMITNFAWIDATKIDWLMHTDIGARIYILTQEVKSIGKSDLLVVDAVDFVSGRHFSISFGELKSSTL